MRWSLLGLVAFATAGAACGAGGARLESLRFSDLRVVASVPAETVSSRFEIDRAGDIRAVLHVAYSRSLFAKTVALTCTVTPPASGPAVNIAQQMSLPRGRTSTDWPVALATSGVSQWVEGTYQVSCLTPGSLAKGNFEVVDTAALLTRQLTPPSVNDLLSKIQNAAPAPAEQKAPVTDAGPSPFSTTPFSFDDFFGHSHDDFFTPEPAPGAPAPPVAPVPSVFRPTIYATDTQDGAAGPDADRFDAATLQYVGYSVHLTSSDTAKYTVRGCVVERRLTGVTLTGSRSTTFGLKDSSLKLGGVSGSTYAGQWLPGEYRVRCDATGVTIEPRTFWVTGRPAPKLGLMHVTTKLPMPDARTTAIRFFEHGGRAAAFGSRRYFTTIGGMARYMAAEVEINLKASDKPQSYDYTCHFFNGNGSLVGRSAITDVIPAGADRRYVFAGWGNPQGTFWQTGTY